MTWSGPQERLAVIDGTPALTKIADRRRDHFESTPRLLMGSIRSSSKMLKRLVLISALPSAAALVLGSRRRPRLVASRPASSGGGCISEETISEVLAVAKLSDVAERHVTVKRSGRTVTACCPFHDDSRPSMVLVLV